MTQHKITFLGDVHKVFGDLAKVIEANPDTDEFIQVGDFGAFWDGENHGLKIGLDKPVSFIAGNHDNWDFFCSQVQMDSAVWPDNLFYIPRNTHWENPSINFLGGAESIDQLSRVLGVSYWDKEIPSYKEFQDFADLPPVEIFVTHTAPIDIVKSIGMYKTFDPVSHALQAIWKGLEKKPKLWFFGHFHQFLDVTVDGTRFICLPCTHDHFFYDANNLEISIRGYPGVTITFEDWKIKSLDIPKPDEFRR